MAFQVSQHDHFGHMVYKSTRCWCDVCGQQWFATRWVMQAVSYSGPYPAGVHKEVNNNQTKKRRKR